MNERLRIWRRRLSHWGWPATLIVLPALFWWQIAFAGRVLVGVDDFTYFYPLRDYTSSMLAAGQLPLWNPYLFLGVPLLANIQAGTFYPLNLALTPLPAPAAINWSILIHLALAGLGVYAYTRRSLTLSRPAAWTSGSVYALGGFLSAQAEHVNQLSVSAWLPWLFLLFDLSIGRSGNSRTPRMRPAAVFGLALVLAICFLAGHTQAWYISLFTLGLCSVGRAFYRAWESRAGGWRASVRAGWTDWWPRLAVLGGGTAIALGLSAAQLLPTLELSGLSIRGGGMDYREAISFSLKPQLLLRAFLPGYGETIFSEYVAYVGWSGGMLALVGAITARPRKAWLTGIGLSICGLFLAFGGYNPFYYVLYRLVPGFALFRAPARWLLLYALGIALLAGIGADAWRTQDVGTAVRTWIAGHRRTLAGICLALLALGLAALAATLQGWMERPSNNTVFGWALALGAIAMLVTLGKRFGVRPVLAIVPGLLLIELYLAGQSLALASPTAWDAFSSLRTAPAHILAAGERVGPDGRPSDDPVVEVPLGDPTAHWGVGAPTFRFISMSGIRYDPGDLGELQAIWQDTLSDDAIYDLIVATKQKEVLAPNLPLLYRIASLDGYDGGVLPLERYVTMQSLLLRPEQILPDGRLREQLERVPSARLLSLLNVEYVVTDKVQDAWIDGTFYDLQFSATLGTEARAEIAVANPYDFRATHVGIISHLEECQEVEDGAVVAVVSWEDAAGQWREIALRAGIETAEGRYETATAHRQPTVGRHLPDEGDVAQYVARLPLGDPQAPDELHIEWVGGAGRLVVNGFTLLDERTGANRSLIVSDSGRFQLVHSGDVKIYRNLDNLPRAYMVGRSDVIADDAVAIETMRDDSFDPSRAVLLHAGEGHDYGWAGLAPVEIESYSASHIVLHSDSPSPGYVVLTDADYPGWVATVDGAPVPIQRANVMFRAIEAPAGRHEIVFRYEPSSFRIGAAISLGTASLLLVISFVTLIRRRARRSAP